MSDPSTLLLSVCVACTSGTEHSIQVELPSCVSGESQRAAVAAGLKRNAPKCISLPEAIAPAPRAVSPSTRAISPPSRRSFYPMARLATEVTAPELVAIRAADGDRASSPSSADVSSLRQGSRGEMVRALQIRLRRLGYYSGAIDGIYGPQTHAAVLKFQQLEDPTADATVDAASKTDWQQHSLVQDLAPRDLAASELAIDGSVANRSATNINAIRQELHQTTLQKREAFSHESFLTSDTSEQERGDRTSSDSTDSDSTETVPANSVKQRVVWEPFSTDPSSTTFYLWLLGWAVVYIGGFVVIFLTSDSQLRQRWLATRSPQHYQGTTPSVVGLEDVINLQDAIDHQEVVDELQDADVPEQLPQQLATPPAVDIPVPPSLPSVPISTVPTNTVSINPVASSKDEADKGAIAPSDPTDEELPVYWADEVFPQIATALVDIENLFDELSAELNARGTTADSTQPLVMEESSAVEPSPIQPSSANAPEGGTPSTIIGILSASESNSDITYTYHLLDDADGSFVLRENELRIKDDVLHAIQTDTSFAVKVRRIDSNGQQLDESFTLHLGMPDLSEANEESDELVPTA